MKKLFALIPLLALSLIAGCTKQAVLASLIAEAGTAISTLESIEGNSALAATLATDFAKLSAAVSTFVPGSATSDVQQIGAIVVSDLNLLPVSAKDALLVSLAVSVVEQVITAVEPPTVTSAHLSLPLHHSTQFKNAADFKKQWNAAVAKSDPSLRAARLK